MRKPLQCFIVVHQHMLQYFFCISRLCGTRQDQLFGATYGLDVECIEAECFGPLKDKTQEKHLLLRHRMPASQHTWQSKRYIFQLYSMWHQNLKSGATSIAQKNFVISVLLKIFSMGTSFLLHQATVMRGSR